MLIHIIGCSWIILMKLSLYIASHKCKSTVTHRVIRPKILDNHDNSMLFFILFFVMRILVSFKTG